MTLRPMFWLTVVATAISLGAAAGPVAWRLGGDEGRMLPQGSAPPQIQAERLNLGPIFAFAPFGNATPIAQPVEVAGETSLNLTLLGVTIATPDTGSRAIVAGGDTPVASYAIGAIITGSARLVQVFGDHVLLDVDGRQELLSFAKTGDAAVTASGGNNLENLIPSAGSDTAPDTAPNAADAVIARYRAAIQQDVTGLLSRLGLEATDQGYRIAQTASAGVRQAGFRPGDLVTTVNGRAVGDVAADQVFFDEVAASGRASIALQRDGQVIVMTFPLR